MSIVQPCGTVHQFQRQAVTVLLANCDGCPGRCLGMRGWVKMSPSCVPIRLSLRLSRGHAAQEGGVGFRIVHVVLGCVSCALMFAVISPQIKPLHDKAHELGR